MGAFGEVKVCHQRLCLEHGVEGAGGGGGDRAGASEARAAGEAGSESFGSCT